MMTRGLTPLQRAAFACACISSIALVACGNDDGPGDETPDAGTQVDVNEDDSSGTDDVGGTEDATDEDTVEADTSEQDSGADTSPSDAGEDVEEDTVDPAPNPDCDPLNEGHCAMPWPSNLYLAEDDARVTGYTLEFGETTLPRNFQRVHVSPDEYRVRDGYSVGTPLLAVFPNIDASMLPGEYSIDTSLADDSELLWFELDEDGNVTRQIPCWAELDMYESDATKQTLFVRPAVILDEATHYVVAFRNLQDTSGSPIPRSAAFEALASGQSSDDPLLATRQSRFDAVFEVLEAQGVDLDEVNLAWDFVTMSSEAMHSDMLTMRQDALRDYPNGSTIEIRETETFTPEEHENWAVIYRGAIINPNYLVEDVGEYPSGDLVGYRLNRDADGRVVQDGTRETPFWIGIPHSAMDGETPHGLIQYGHGLLGAGDGTVGHWTNNAAIGNEHDFIFFGSNYVGMDENDFGRIAAMIFDFNYFYWIPEMLHQGFIEQMLFARAMVTTFPEMTEIAELGVVVNTDELFFEGISQGGIYGGAQLAISPDMQLAHLSVAGSNYNTLLHRAVGFEEFFLGVNAAYPGRASQAVLLSTAQLLWDSADSVTYYRHLEEDPFFPEEENSTKFMLSTIGVGDFQVSNLPMEALTRSGLGVALMTPYHPDRDMPLAETAEYPRTGSGHTVYDFGGSWPSVGNLPPQGEYEDPHDLLRFNAEHTEQLVHFFRSGGEIIDVCGGTHCEFESAE